MGKIADLFVKLSLKNKGFNDELNKSEKKTRGFGNALKSVGGAIAGYFAFDTILRGVVSVVKKNAEFEKSLSTLKSLTGVTAEELKFYEQEAKRMGATTTQTASQVADAFTLIGSKKPELLQSKDALVEVTEQAIILAEAANTDVVSSATAIANSLNQMGKDADSAGKFINVLAAGSKFGAANIQYLNAAIEKAGGAANATGLDFGGLVAAIETIAPKIAEPTTAGLQLRQILVKLQKETSKYNPSVVGLGEALKNLSKDQLTINDLTKKFGILNVNAAKALIDGADKFEQYRLKVTGTNTALEQQAINVDNLQGSISRLESAWEGLILKAESSDFIRGFIDAATELISASETVTQSAERQTKTTTEGLKSSSNSAKEYSDALANALKVQEEIAKEANSFSGVRGRKATLAAIKNAKVQAKIEENLRKELAAALIKTEQEELSKRFDLKNASVSKLENLEKSYSSFTSGEMKRRADIILPLIKKELEERVNAKTKEVEGIASLEKELANLEDIRKTAHGAELARANNEILAIKAKIKALEEYGTKVKEVMGAKVAPVTPATQGGIVSGVTGQGLPDTISTEGTFGQQILDDQANFLSSFKDFNSQAEGLATDFVADTVEVFAEGLGEMLAGDFNAADFGKMVLQGVGNFLSMLGKMMIQFGATALIYSTLAKALSNPATAAPAAVAMIAAGAALVAIGSAIGSAASGSSSSSGVGSITTIDTRGTTNTSSSIQQIEATPVTVTVQGEIKNSVIALSNKLGTKQINR